MELDPTVFDLRSQVLLCAVVLTNINLQRIPGPSFWESRWLQVACWHSNFHLWRGSSTPSPFGYSIHKLRIVLLQWGLVAAAYYFIERSAQRAAELCEAELERRRIEAQMLEARVQVMQAQVEPHFLFNTLAHVQRLYQVDPARGRAMLGSFCDYLRARCRK
jgi:hypothetical protein